MNEHVEAVVAAAKAMLGWPYQWGGLTKTGIDCRGFVRKAFGNVGLRGLIGGALGNVREQVRWAKENGRFRGPEVPPRRGWLVFYSNPITGAGPDKLQHVGIVLRAPSLMKPRGRVISAVVPRVAIHRLVPDNLTLFGYCEPAWPAVEVEPPIVDPEPPVVIEPDYKAMYESLRNAADDAIDALTED